MQESAVLMKSTVLGATGIVGGFIKDRLVKLGEQPFALSRVPQKDSDGVRWIQGDLTSPELVKLPPSEIIYSTVHPLILANAIEWIASPVLRKLVFFTSTSIITKIDSNISSERDGVRQLANGERILRDKCEERNIDWTILRPTIVYAEGRDANVTRLSRFIDRFGFFPLAGRGNGRRQPVHAGDLANAAIAAATSPYSSNKVYALPGRDLLTYHEMVGRIFDSLGKPRIIVPVPPLLWKFAFIAARPFFPNANHAMGERMSKDMIFDGRPAAEDFGWNPRPFRPRFVMKANQSGELDHGINDGS